MSDTMAVVEERMASMMAAQSPAERLRMASSMFDTGKTLLQAGLRRQYKSLSDRQLREMVFLRLYGDDFTGSEARQIISCIFANDD
jgi:hypothetical protein